jgi:hypothetical protein
VLATRLDGIISLEQLAAAVTVQYTRLMSRGRFLLVAAFLCGGAALAGTLPGCAGHKASTSHVTPVVVDNGPLDGSFADGAGPTVGAVTGITTKLPSLPELSNVVAELNDDSATITFDPVDDAVDYRVYPLPADGDIDIGADGQVVVHNAIYRCAGTRETEAPYVDDAAAVQSDAIHTEVDGQTVGGYLRTLADATLGYVYTQPGPGLIPVYVLGDSDPNADSTCYFARWQASRSKEYTTSESDRAQLLANLARDDGIAFYVPGTSDSTTTEIYTDVDSPGMQYASRYYFPDGAESAAHPNKVDAFPVLTAAAPGTLPLMRVFYQNACGWSHDELAVGQSRFNRVYLQGDKQPWWSLLWTGITGPTTLVVEALDSGCPFQGHLSPASIPGQTSYFGTTPIVHQPFVTVDDMRDGSATTEVFINGQYDAGVPAQLPKAVARSFVNVVPNPHPTMDFFAAFSPQAAPETFTTVPCGALDGNCFAAWRQQSPTFDQMFIDMESVPDGGGLFAYGPVMGELLVTYADVGADTNGKYRLTANQKATMGTSSFLHVTMEVDAYSTARRYPQIIISDQVAPVQYTLQNGHSIVVQPRADPEILGDWPIEYQLQICNLRTWDVNNQCPDYNLWQLTDSTGTVTHLAPNDEVGEHASVDHRVRFDVYASTQRTYLFLDEKPYACALMPSVGVPSGPVTVTWGDVLYHSAVDDTLAFHMEHMQVETRRHFDNLGFSSGVPAPGWDESRLPCVQAITP